MTTPPQWKGVNPIGATLFDIAQVVRGIMLGRVNAHGEFTLTENDTSTVVTTALCRPNSHVTITPQTATAAADVGSATGVYVVAGDGSFTVTHPNTADTDKTFTFGIIG